MRKYIILTLTLMAFAVLGVGVFFHFVCGIPAGNVSLFDTENGVVEQRREYGNFSPFARNLLQLVVVVAVAYFFVDASQIRATFDLLLSENGVADLMAEPMSLITPVLHLLILVILIAMIYYAAGTIEFDIEGPEAPGRKRFLALSVLLLLCAGGAFAYVQFVEQAEANINVILIAVVALVAVIIELALRDCPNPETENLDEVDVGTYLTQSCNGPGVYVNYMASSAFDFGSPSAVYARRR